MERRVVLHINVLDVGDLSDEAYIEARRRCLEGVRSNVEDSTLSDQTKYLMIAEIDYNLELLNGSE